jgi:hypothetical protein
MKVRTGAKFEHGLRLRCADKEEYQLGLRSERGNTNVAPNKRKAERIHEAALPWIDTMALGHETALGDRISHPVAYGTGDDIVVGTRRKLFARMVTTKVGDTYGHDVSRSLDGA